MIPQENIELRLRTMRVVWIAMILNIAGLFLLTLFVKRREDLLPNPTLSIALLGVAVSAVLISFAIKSKLLNRAFEQQQLLMVQQAYVVAFAINEVGALSGLLDFFTTSDRFYYVLLMVGALGQLLHFPRREHVLNASGKPAIY